jgi:hypothetical protein
MFTWTPSTNSTCKLGPYPQFGIANHYITIWSILFLVLLEKLIVPHLVKKFYTFCITQRFTTVFIGPIASPCPKLDNQCFVLPSPICPICTPIYAKVFLSGPCKVTHQNSVHIFSVANVPHAPLISSVLI